MALASPGAGGGSRRCRRGHQYNMVAGCGGGRKKKVLGLGGGRVWGE
jgi:hypothetical protein